MGIYVDDRLMGEIFKKYDTDGMLLPCPAPLALL